MSGANSKWTVDLSSETASHSSGFTVKFEGIPGSSNFSGFPTKTGQIPHLQLLTLLRQGCRVYEHYFRKHGGQSAPVPTSRRPVIMKKPSRRAVVATAERD